MKKTVSFSASSSFSFICLLALIYGALFPGRLHGSDAVADFSTNANPNGVWSYGWATNAGGQFQLLTVPLTINGGPDAGWWNGGSLPDSYVVDKDFSSNSIQSGTVIFDPDTLHMDPQSHACIVRFTAPSNGAYEVAGLFRLQDTGTQAHDLSIVLNTNITAYDVYTSGGVNGSEYPFSFPCSLNQGQTIDFIVSYANTYDNLGTGLKATVTPSTNAAPHYSYSATGNFSTNSNPDGVWSYVFWPNTTFSGNAQLLASNVYPVAGLSAIFDWWNGGSLANETSVTIGGDETSNPYSSTEFPNVIYYPDSLHEDPEGLAVAARFTAPFSAPYSIQGFFRVEDANLQSSGNAALLQIITNQNAGSPEFSANSRGAPLGSEYSFAFTNFLAQGATVDFAVTGAGGDVHNLSSGLNATITPLLPVQQSPAISNGIFSFSFSSTSNVNYTIQTTTNLSQSNWINFSNFTGSGSLQLLEVPVISNLTAQFFRLSIP